MHKKTYEAVSFLKGSTSRQTICNDHNRSQGSVTFGNKIIKQKPAKLSTLGAQKKTYAVTISEVQLYGYLDVNSKDA